MRQGLDSQEAAAAQGAEDPWWHLGKLLSFRSLLDDCVHTACACIYT